MPPLLYELMDLYPQAAARRPSVLYVPLHRTPGSPEGADAGPTSAK